MTVKSRILAIRLSEKIEKNPAYSERIGLLKREWTGGLRHVYDNDDYDNINTCSFFEDNRMDLRRGASDPGLDIQRTGISDLPVPGSIGCRNCL